ncbi:MAG: type 4a pilus biogenesis protein PilO [Selenomonadaceae bacterium]|nr:type 4a pilus biogenesis protein PilO [Selenomonadaceae bacterium]
MREKSFLPTVFGTCAAAAVLFWLLVYTPLKAEISAMRLETQQLQLQARELETLHARYGNLVDFAEKVDERLILAQEFLPAKLDDEKFIESLYQIAGGKKILINSVQVGEISEGDVQRQSVRVQLDADYISLLNFIREVLDGGRLVTLENFSLEGSGVLNCELEFYIFAVKR